MRTWLEEKRRREAEFGKGPDEPPDGPGCSMRYWVLEAAREYGCDGLRGFLSQPRVWQAEMVAHLIIKGQRSLYEAAQLKAWEETKKRGRGRKFVDPGESQRRKWMV